MQVSMRTDATNVCRAPMRDDTGLSLGPRAEPRYAQRATHDTGAGAIIMTRL